MYVGHKSGLILLLSARFFQLHQGLFQRHCPICSLLRWYDKYVLHTQL